MTRQKIIMVHGFRGTHHGLVLIADKLRDQYEVLVPDLPGFAKGEKLSTHNLESYVTWLKDYIKTNAGDTPPILLGHSFGSIVASAYTRKYPTSITKLILVNPIGAPALEGPRKVLTKLAIFYYKLGEYLPERAAYQWLAFKPIVMVMSVSMAKTKDKQLRSFIHDQHLTHFSSFHSAKSVSEAFKTSVSHDVSEFAADILVPTLIIAGALDDITPLAKQFELAKKFPDATITVIDNVGHLTHYETPEEIASRAKKWLHQAKSSK